jgi:hypothetical protein
VCSWVRFPDLVQLIKNFNQQIILMAKTNSNLSNKGVIVRTMNGGTHVGVYLGEQWHEKTCVIHLLNSRKLKNVNCINNLFSDEFLDKNFIQGSEVAVNISLIGCTEMSFISNEMLARLSNLPKF